MSTETKLRRIINEEIEQFVGKTAVIEINIPVAYLSLDKYIQAVPLHVLDNRMVYINVGGEAGKSISTKNVSVLKVFNAGDEENIKSFIQQELGKKSLNEDMDMEEWTTVHTDYERDIFNMINHKEHIKFRLIPKNQYHRALQEFIKYGEFMRFPENLILKWKDLILRNMAKLEVLTSIAGHTENFPFDEFSDVFDYNHDTGEDNAGEFSQWRKQRFEETGEEEYNRDDDWGTAYEFLDKIKHMDDYLPLFSNGQWVLSDFGLQPLFKIGGEMTENSNANELIVLINKALDVTHQRSDLAELFIEGGSATLDQISNN